MADPTAPPEPPSLRLLRRLVTTLTLVMILGMITVVTVLVLRLRQPLPPVLPDAVTLPEGASAHAVTFGEGWFAVVTTGDEILIFDAASGALRQRVVLTPAP